MVYTEGEEGVDFDKLALACEEISEHYGEEMEGLLVRMLQREEEKRPSLVEVKRVLKNQRKSRKSISRY
jgi:hypothetical protein